MSITVPGPGDPITAADFGAPVANLLNQIIILTGTASQTTASTSYSNVAGLTFPVTAGKIYLIRLWGQYICTAVGNGFTLAHNGPAAPTTDIAHLTAYGNGGATTALVERQTAYDTSTGIATVDSTASRMWFYDSAFQPSVDGTWALRWKRPGATNSNITMLQSGGLVLVSA